MRNRIVWTDRQNVPKTTEHTHGSYLELLETLKLYWLIDLEAVGYVSDNEKYTYNDMLTLVEKIVEERLNKENQLNVDIKRFLELLNDTTKWTEEKEKELCYLNEKLSNRYEVIPHC